MREGAFGFVRWRSSTSRASDLYSEGCQGSSDRQLQAAENCGLRTIPGTIINAHGQDEALGTHSRVTI